MNDRSDAIGSKQLPDLKVFQSLLPPLPPQVQIWKFRLEARKRMTHFSLTEKRKRRKEGGKEEKKRGGKR